MRSPESWRDAPNLQQPGELQNPSETILLAPVRDPRTELAGSGLAAGSQPPEELQLAAPWRGETPGSLASWKRDRPADRAAAPHDRHPRDIADRSREAYAGQDPLQTGALGSESTGDPGRRGPRAIAGGGTAEPTPGSQIKPSGIAWPRTPSLDAALAELGRVPVLAAWCDAIRRELSALQDLDSIQHPAAGPRIATLRSLAQRGLAYGESRDDDRPLQVAILRAAHGLQRRALVWHSVWTVGAAPRGATLVRWQPAGQPETTAVIDALRQRSLETGDPQGWQRYLLLEEFAALSAESPAAQRKWLAQRLLSRLRWDGLSERQRAWLDQPEVVALERHARPWAESPVDFAVLLAQLERLESDAIDLGGIDVAAAVQSLRFSANPHAVDVARAINDYYRNANLRLAVSGALLERLLPEVPGRATPIRQRILGVPVRGSGWVESQLTLRLVPDPQAWRLELRTDGTMHGRTGASQGPVRIANGSQSQFAAFTPISIDRHSVSVGGTEAQVRSRVQLRGLRTDYDGWPLIENLVRAIAISEYRRSAPLARRQSESVFRRELEQQVGSEVDKEVRGAAAELSSRLLGPLGSLRLDPLVVDLETTESRLVARYRLAGDWQMAAFTPRPRALRRSLLSLQVHQSLLNNTFEQLAPADEARRLVDLHAELWALFGVEDAAPPADLPDDVSIRFAGTRPITVEIDEDRLWLTLRVVRLTKTGEIDLSHFVVRACYRPVRDGLRSRLEREGPLKIDGPRLGFREKLPVRAIFAKVLASDKALPLVAARFRAHPAAEDLTVGLLELTDGWLSLSISPRPRAGEAVPTATASL
jgi:hypothetical protein